MRAHKGKAQLLRTADKDARATVFMMERVAGNTFEGIAKKYSCSPTTVQKYVNYARDHQLIVEDARHKIGENLVPLALAVYEMKLRDGDLEAARDIVFGIGILRKESKHVTEASAEDTLEGFRRAYFDAKAQTAKDAEVVPQGILVASTTPLSEDSQDEQKHQSPGRFPDLHRQGEEDPDE